MKLVLAGTGALAFFYGLSLVVAGLNHIGSPEEGIQQSLYLNSDKYKGTYQLTKRGLEHEQYDSKGNKKTAIHDFQKGITTEYPLEGIIIKSTTPLPKNSLTAQHKEAGCEIVNRVTEYIDGLEEEQKEGLTVPAYVLSYGAHNCNPGSA